MNSVTYEIIKVEKSNYHMFDDMVFRRVNGIQRKALEESKYHKTDFSNIFIALNNHNFHVYAALTDAIFVGWISIIYMPKVGYWNGSGIIYIDELWVDPTYRGKGIGKSLIKKADELKDTLHAAKIRLYVEENNDTAINLYEKCDFIINGKAFFMEK